MAYASLNSKPQRRRMKAGHYEQHLTAWWHLYRLLRFLKLKGLATLVYATPRPGTIIYKNGQPWKTHHIRLRRHFKLTVVGKLPEQNA